MIESALLLTQQLSARSTFAIPSPCLHRDHSVARRKCEPCTLLTGMVAASPIGAFEGDRPPCKLFPLRPPKSEGLAWIMSGREGMQTRVCTRDPHRHGQSLAARHGSHLQQKFRCATIVIDIEEVQVANVLAAADASRQGRVVGIISIHARLESQHGTANLIGWSPVRIEQRVQGQRIGCQAWPFANQVQLSPDTSK